ncbi:zinc ribbon domain-containing protein [Methanospirillum sp.]|uniref:zinc ribbon domain-containing protein n=1 Tax=Methanospirillum sp. TaxID=45200 RepID=UPI002982F902|nr:zinc ribbon domain-containing protein [Methanospirillum sp.]
MFCPHCGSDIPPDGSFCQECGKTVSNVQSSQDSLVWTSQIPVITSSVFVKQLGMALGSGFLVVFVIILFVHPEAVLSLAPVLFVIWLFLFGISLGIALIYQKETKGGPDALFKITPEGISYAAGETMKKVNQLTAIGSILLRSLSGLGVSMMNKSRETDLITWDQIRSISYQNRERTVLVYRKILIRPILLACTKENFSQVKDLISRYAPPGTIK